MDAVLNVINFILDLGPSVMMPIIITILGLALRQNFVKSFRAGLIIGVGFVGINTIIGLLTGTLGPVTQAMVKNMGVSLDIMDVGWPISAAVSFGSVVVPVVMPAILIINVIMLAFNWTKTANVDVWNYWQILFCASIVYHTTGNNWLWTIVATIICTAVTLVLADISASTIQKFFGMPGISCRTLVPSVGIRWQWSVTKS